MADDTYDAHKVAEAARRELARREKDDPEGVARIRDKLAAFKKLLNRSD